MLAEPQLGLFDPRPEPDASIDESDVGLEARWRAFHAANPEVYRRLCALALYARSKGAARLSINLLFERLRWELVVETVGDEFRLNNNHRPYYARELMRREPELAGLFETRALAEES